MGPFIDQAIQTDDTLFVWTAQWIQKHPGDFFGFPVNWWGSTIPMWMANYNPPVWPYLLAVVGSVLGWHEVVLHLGGFAVAFATAAGIYLLAKEWCVKPVLATVIAVFTPSFLVLGTTLMCDMTTLMFWVWAMVLWERAEGAERKAWHYWVAGLLAGVAVLTKYSALTLLPLLALLSVSRLRRPNWNWLALLVPVLMLAGYEWVTARLYGHGLFSLAGRYVRERSFSYPGGWHAKAIIGLAFAGGSMLPMLFFTPWLWRWRSWLAGAVVLLGAGLGFFVCCPDPGLFHPWGDPGGVVMHRWDFRFQVIVLSVAGIQLLLLAALESWKRRDRVTIVLALWIVGVFFFTTVLNWTINARSFLPAAPAVAILVVRRLTAKEGRAGKWLLLPLTAAGCAVLAVAVANLKKSNEERFAASQITAEFNGPGHQLWFNGHSGFQYYMEKQGALPLDIEHSLLRPGDAIAVPLLGSFVVLPPGTVAPAKNFAWRPDWWINVEGSSTMGSAGFYTSDDGPLPFSFGGLPTQEFLVVKVFSQLQYQTKPDNAAAILAGALPGFSHTSYSLTEVPPPPDNPVAAEEARKGMDSENAGHAEEAIAHYQTALNSDSNNIVALTQLAHLRATVAQTELRDSKQAVELASRAVQATDWRRSAIVLTLAAAYASDGQYRRAMAVAEFVRGMGILTGDSQLTASSVQMIRSCNGAIAQLTAAGTDPAAVQ